MGQQLIPRMSRSVLAALTALIVLPVSGALASDGGASGKAARESGKSKSSSSKATAANPGSLNTVAPLSIAAAFSPAVIQPNGSSTLTVTVTNPSANTVASGGVAFTDKFPANVVIASPNGITNTCGGTATGVAGSDSLTLTGGTLTTNGNCAVSVKVTSAFTGTYLNGPGPASSKNGGRGKIAGATLTASAPIISKLFLPDSIPEDGTALLSFTIENENDDTTLTGISFTDNLPTGLVVATPNNLSNSCGGTVTATAGSSSITLLGGSLGPEPPLVVRGRKKLHGVQSSEKPQDGPESDGDCFISVSVQPTTTGPLNNTSGVISANESGAGATSNTATLTVTPAPSAPSVTKAFSGATVGLGATSTLTFTFTNPNASTSFVALGVSDTLPSGLAVANPNGAGGTCVTSDSGVITATPGSHSISIGSISLPNSSSCTATVNVVGTAAGEQDNVSGNVTGSFDPGTGGPLVTLTGNTASANITVLEPPTIRKAFANPQVMTGSTTTLTFTLTNPNSSAALSGVQFSDTFPAGLVVASPLSVTDNCGGTFTASAGASSVGLTGGSIPASSSCTISVAVEPTTSGTKSNITGAVSSANGGGGTTSNTASIFAFNVCLQDDSSGDTLQWSTTTGAYIFTHCKTGFTLSGTGVTSTVGGSDNLTDSEKTQKVTASFNTGSLTGHAVITVVLSPGLTQTYTINQTKTHVTCSCSGH
jgi:uncharacterized repeat protein (TIGR01451 family)